MKLTDADAQTRKLGGFSSRGVLLGAVVVVAFAVLAPDLAGSREGVRDAPDRELFRVVFGVHEQVVLYLPREYMAIRPAAIDGMLPPIPPSELWPSQ
jgi:hypothetical protein